MLNRHSMPYRCKLSSAVALSLLFSYSAHAEVNFSGFATLAGGMTTGSDEVFEVSRGNSYDDKYDFKPDSLFGLQASADLSEGMKATAQITARGADDWNAAFEWAYLSFDITDDWRLLLGRQRSPQNLYSDFVDVSYAYHWLRAPNGLYAPSFDSYDGVGSIYNFNFGDVENQLHILIGRSSDNPFGDIVDAIDISNYWIAAYTLNWNWLTARAAYGQRELFVGFAADKGLGLVLYAPDLGGALPAGTLPDGVIPTIANAGFTDVVSEIEVDDDTSEVFTLSLRADIGSVFGVAEWSSDDTGDNMLGDSENWYASGGVRIGSWTLHVTYGVNETTAADSSFLDPVFAAGIAALPNQELLIAAGTVESTMAAFAADQDYYIIGARWDFKPAAALQLEYTDYTDNLDEGNNAGLINVGVVTVF